MRVHPDATTQRGFALLGLVALLVAGALFLAVQFFTSGTPSAQREKITGDALVQARDALMGYVAQYREYQLTTGTDNAVYGYLPMPDLGESQNRNSDLGLPCATEGCAKLNNAGVSAANTYIGRFPWRTLGLPPLRDGYGECLWYIVSGSHKALENAGTMNWDTLGHIDIVVADGTAALKSTLASKPHDRPVAIIFSPGPPLPGQNRADLGGDDVSQCGGNYTPANYLDPAVATVQGGASVYFSGSTTIDASTPNLAIATNGGIDKAGSNFHSKCPQGSNCSTVSNDRGLVLTGDALFGALRKSSNFRLDINNLLDRMVGCARDQIVAGTFIPASIPGFAAAPPPVAGDKAVGRIPSNSCYDDTQTPKGYFSHYQDQIFAVALPANNCPFFPCLTVTVDGAPDRCAGTLLVGGQRGAKSPNPIDLGESFTQIRTSDAVSITNSISNRNWPANYLEDANLASFANTAQLIFAGASQFGPVKASKLNPLDVTRCTAGSWIISPECHTADQDIVRCIPAGASFTTVAPSVSVSTFAGSVSLADYISATRTLTLGSAEISSNYGAAAASLFACAWTPEVHAGNGGFRSYFRFRVRRVGEGFTFAVIDGDRNDTTVCGASRQHLGYSGNNSVTPYIQAPKLAIEFDTARQCNSPTFDAIGRPACTFIETGDTLLNGRNDPCYTSGCWTGSIMPPPYNGNDNSSHVAVVYWGYGSALGQPTQDDNVHDQLGMPMPTDPSPRPGPRNPAPVLPYLGPPTYPDPMPTPGIAPLDRMGSTDISQREFHARIEVARTFTAPLDAKNGATGVQVKFWIEPHPAKSISAMTYNAGSPPTLTVTATGHGYNTGDTVVIKEAQPSGYNGEYPITVVNANTFTATLLNGTPNPGRYISSMTWESVTSGTDLVTVTSPNHGLNNGETVTISGAIPPEFNGTYAIVVIDANSYQFGRELRYEPGDSTPAIAAAKALTPRALALSNTTRPMSQLDATFKPLVSDTATIYDEQTVACGTGCPSGQSCASDNMCYRPSFRNLRLGFTLAERPTASLTKARGELIEIKDFFTTWLP